MAIELDLLFLMGQLESMYSSDTERWGSLKEIIREQYAAQQSVQSDASPVERCDHGNPRGQCYVEVCSFSKYGERR